MITQCISIADVTIWLTCAVVLATEVVVVWLNRRYSKLRKTKDSEYFTDYTHGKLTMRVFKNEFEFQAKKNIPSGKIVDGGVLSAFYMWVLFEE